MSAAVPWLLAALALGGLLLGLVKGVEYYAALRFAQWLLPSGESGTSLTEFPTLAVQVSASLLGFYLASVSIVLGTSYHDVSADVRRLILANPQVRIYLFLIGISIGAGLALLLLEALSIEFGYLTLGSYAVLVGFSGWSFMQLASRAFDLFNPVELAELPLQTLQRRIDGVGRRRPIVTDGDMKVAADDAGKSLSLLSELIQVTGKRMSVDQSGLASLVERLLCRVRSYAGRKHLMSPENGWFISGLTYPRWVEAGYSEASRALGTSTPLQPVEGQTTDWLENRAATLVVDALRICAAEDNREAALSITRAAELTTRALAVCSRFDEASTFCSTVSNFCWNPDFENDTAAALASEPTRFLIGFLEGCSAAIAGWPSEAYDVVSRTRWDSRRTKMVRIVGPVDVCVAADRLLNEVRAEREVEGQRASPDWYLRLALAEAYIFALLKLTDQIPKLIEEFAGLHREPSSPAMEATVGIQALQALAEAESLGNLILDVAEALETLRLGNERRWKEQFDGLSSRIDSLRLPILVRIAAAIPELQPAASSSAPDLYGEAFFRLIHHTEEATYSGNNEVARRVFPHILPATLTLEGYLITTYGSPIYQYSPAIFDPVVGLMELSGLSMVYRELDGDQCTDPVRAAWEAYIGSMKSPETAARWFLDILDLVEHRWPPSMSAQSIARSRWQTRLARRVIEAGYAMPMYFPGFTQPEWVAPPLVKRLGITESVPSILIQPYAVFAAEVIAPLADESDEMLRSRPALELYLEEKDRYPDLSNQVDGDPVSGCGGEVQS